MCDKITIRKKYKQIRSNISESYRNQASKRLCQFIVDLPVYKNSEYILLYAAIQTELDLNDLANQALKDGKKIYFPKCFGSDMLFFRINSLNELSKGMFDVPEPTNLNIEFNAESGLILVPGLAFSDKKYRIGYGKGYYDKYLCKHPGLYTIGVGFHEQFHADFIESDLDISMQKLYSEQGEES